MKETKRAQGNVVIRLPDNAGKVSDPKLNATGRRSGSGSTVTESDATAELNIMLSALAEQDSIIDHSMDTIDRFVVDVGDGTGSSTQPSRRGSTRQEKPDKQELSIDVKLNAGESAVILIEQDGSFEWHYPGKQKSSTSTRGSGSRAGRASQEVETTTVSFQIPIGDSYKSPRPTRGQRSHRGPITSFIKGKVSGFILKFIARKTIGALTRRLERGVNEGPVLINSSTDATQWQSLPAFPVNKLPTDRPGRVLLLVHGTFSSTLGSYGALTATDQGQSLLDNAINHYDLVVGFDHYTLSDTPEQNAEAMLEHLLPLLGSAEALEIDAIAFSRGGLVFRYLSEVLIPDTGVNIIFRKAVFVACTNAGTELANDSNWKHLVDFYTNMVAGATRLIGLAPGAALPAKILRQGIKTIGSLVTYMAQDGVANNSVPGVAAMEPDGEFVTALNTAPAQRLLPGARSYYAIGSNFEPSEVTKGLSLGKRLVLKVADGFVDKLMGKHNDLVVNNDSMHVVDPVPGARLVEQHAMQANGEIYHTVYFHQSMVARTCGEWLDLFAIKPAQTRGAASKAEPSQPRSWWKSTVTDDFLLLPATTSIAEARKRLKKDSSQTVVLQRLYEGELLFYGFTRQSLEEAMSQSTDKHISLFDWFGLQESGASSISIEQALGSTSPRELQALAARQGHEFNIPGSNLSVITTDGRPSGVVRSQLQDEAPRTASRGPADTNNAARSGGARRESAGGAQPPSAPLPGDSAHLDTPDKVLCHMHALMPEQVAVDSIATVEVTLSRDLIARESGLSGAGDVSTERPLIIQLIARKHCDIVGSAKTEIAVPEPGVEIPLFFDVQAKHKGVGEIDVLARQGNQPVITLKLRPNFIKKTGQVNSRNTVATGSLQDVPLKAELADVLYIYDGEMGNKRILDFHFYAPNLGIQGRYRSEPFRSENARLEYITNLYKEIEDFWADEQSDYDAFMQKLMARGANLFDKLVPTELQALLWKARDSIGAIQVYSDEPFVPWELLYLKQPGKPARQDSFFLVERGLFRWLSNTRYAPDEIHVRPDGFKHIVPNYPRASGYALAGAQAERKMLESRFSAKSITANTKAVQTALTDVADHDILHFACHGLADSASIWNAGLMMKGKMDGSNYIEDHLTSEWAAMFADLQTHTATGPLVFLNACQIGRQGYNLTGTGGFAEAFVKSGASAFVGSHWSVGDDPAFVFSETFYQELLENGATMMDAVFKAREAAKNNQEITWLAYAVYADPFARIVTAE